MAHLSRLTLSHFRSYKHTTIEAPKGPIVLHGPNGAGKTNIIEAISMLSPGRGLRRSRVEEMTRQPDAVGWKISAHIQAMGMVHELETTYTGVGGRSVQIDNKAAPQLALAKIARMVWLVPVMDRLWVEGADGRRRFLDRLTLSFTPSHAQSVLTYEKSMRERNRMLKEQIQDPAWYGAVEASMVETGTQIIENRNAALARLEDAQKDATTEFPFAALSMIGHDGGPATQSGDALKAAFADGRMRDLAAGRTLSGPHRDDMLGVYGAKETDAKLCSTGEQKALLVSIILANARALKSDIGAPPILLLDEVAAHLDANRQAALYDEICALGAQAWMTGTGADLFEALGDRATRFEILESAEGTNIK